MVRGTNTNPSMKLPFSLSFVCHGRCVGEGGQNCVNCKVISFTFHFVTKLLQKHINIVILNVG